MFLWRDLKYAVRILAKAPGFSFVAIALLAVGIAATPAVFSFADALFWKPPDAPHADRLVRAFIQSQRGIGGQFSYPEFREFRDHARAFESLAAEYPTAPLNLVADNESREHNGAVVSGNYFSLLGLKPVRGRFFNKDEDSVPDRDPVAVISGRLWRSRFGGEPSAVGREIAINGVTFHVIGIAPDNFYGDEPGMAAIDLWIPTAMLRTGYRWCDAYADAQCTVLHLIGRLAEGRTASDAEVELNNIANGQHLPSLIAGARIKVLPATGIRPEQQVNMSAQVRLLLAIAVMLLLIACANVAGLLVARGAARRKELSVRLALGARPVTIARQLLVENALLAAVAAVFGITLGFWLRDGFASLYTLQTEGGDTFYNLNLDGRQIFFVAVIALLTGVLFGLLPAFHAAGGDMLQGLKTGGGSLGSRSGTRARDLLAAAQVALCLVLLVAAGLMVRSAQHILGGANFDPEQVVLLRLRPRLVKYSPAEAEKYFRAVVRRVPLQAGVADVGYGTGGSGLLWNTGIGKTMRLESRGEPDKQVRVLPVNNSFFATLRIPVLQGRTFTDQDQFASGGGDVLVVNQAAAHHYWPATTAVEQSLMLDGRAYRVVGVVADIGLRSLDENAAPQLYSPYWQSAPGAQGDMRMAVRVNGDPAAALSKIHSAISSVDPQVPIAEEMLLSDQVKSEYSTVWLARAATLWCGVVALCLSAVGLYSVLAFNVRCRMREIGLRVALGARRADVARLIVRKGLTIFAIGAVSGLVISLFTWRLLGSLLYGVRSLDLFAFLGGPLILGIVTVLSSYLPARRATRVDPMVALRYE